MGESARAGSVLAGRYWLTGLLGRGVMGAGWRAHDKQLGREVAVNVDDPPVACARAPRADGVPLPQIASGFVIASGEDQGGRLSVATVYCIISEDDTPFGGGMVQRPAPLRGPDHAIPRATTQTRGAGA